MSLVVDDSYAYMYNVFCFSEPCPSPKFQSLLADMLTKDSEAATRFLDTLLNQLNWSFSEFIGMLQEVSGFDVVPNEFLF